MSAKTKADDLELKRSALQIRRNILRMIRAGKSGHLGGALSMVEVLTALYFRVMNIDPSRPDWPARDRLIISAGHKALVLYAALAARGYFPEEVLDTYGSMGSRLPGHPDMHKLPGVEASTGALGHGLSIAGGMALGLRMSKLNSKVYAVMGDGEVVVCGAETPGEVTLTPQVVDIPGLPTPFLENDEIVAVIASGETTDAAYKLALDMMHGFLTGVAGLSINDAAMLMSLVGNLKFCQVVDPLLTVRFEFPKSVLADYGYRLPE